LLFLAKPVAAHAILSAAIDATEEKKTLAADRAQLLRSLGRTLYLLARYRESEAAYRTSVDIFTQLGDPYEAQALASRKLLAQLLAEGAQYVEADLMYSELLRDTEKVYGPESPEIASTLSSIGLMLNGQGKYDAAISLAARARNIFVHHWGSDYPELGWCFFVFATAYRQKNELEEASRWYSLAITRFVQMHGEEHPIPLRSMYGLAVLLQKKGDLVGSIVQARKIVALRTKLLGSKHADTAAAKVLLGSVLKANGEYTEAMTLLSEGLEVFDGGVNKEHPEVARTLHELGEVYGRLKLHDKARASLARAVAIRTKVLGVEHPDTMASTALLDVITTAAGGELVLPGHAKVTRS
jgi:tetratricopeptide (TPR) repeat protein